MKKLICILLLVLIGCSSPESDNKDYGINSIRAAAQARAIQEKQLSYHLPNIQVLEYDSCEYVVSGSCHDSQTLAHKGNCKYCKARK